MTSKLKISQAVIFCGGRGSRLGEITKTTPKPLLNINKKPFLFHLIKKLENEGVSKILLLTGYKNTLFDKFIVNFATELTSDISTNFMPEEYETAQRLKNVVNVLDKNFFLLYGDNYWDGNFKQHVNLKKNNDIVTTVFKTYKKEKGNISIKSLDKDIMFSKTKKLNYDYLDMGFMVADKEALKKFFLNYHKNEKFSDVIFPYFNSINKLGLVTTEVRHQSIGTIEGLSKTKNYLKHKKFIFLDRDGVLNERPKKADYVKDTSEFIWKKNSIKGVNYLCKLGYKIIIISNQPGVARGKMTLENLNQINKKIKQDLIKYNSKIHDFFYCLHDWNDGCSCRKPEPGLLIQAQYKYNLQLSNHIFIGDDSRDINAGEKVFMKSYLLDKRQNLYDLLKELNI